MNWVFTAALLILGYHMIKGYKKGFLRTVYSLVSWLIITAFAAIAAPCIQTYFMEHTALYETMREHCSRQLQQSFREKTQSANGSPQQLEQNFDGETFILTKLGMNLPDAALENSQTWLKEILENSEIDWDDILKSSAAAADEFLEENGIYEAAANQLAAFILKGISFFVALTAAKILVSLLSYALKIVSKIPFLGGADRIIGLFAGGIYGLLCIWIVLGVLAVISATRAGNVLISYINQSNFLTFLYENNLILHMFA